MATVEIEKDILDQYLMAYNLQKSLHDDDASREDYERALKKKFPDKYKTTTEKAETYLKPLKDELDSLKKWKKQREESEQDGEFNQSVARLKKERNYSDEGIEELKKLMIEKNIPDIEVAADHFDRKNPPKAIESTGFSERGWNFSDGADEKGTEANDWFKNPDRMFDKIAAEEFGKKRKVA